MTWNSIVDIVVWIFLIVSAVWFVIPMSIFLCVKAAVMGYREAKEGDVDVRKRS